MAPELRLKMALLIFGLTRAGTSTTLYAKNVTGLNMHMWTASMLVKPVLNSILGTGLFDLFDQARNADVDIVPERSPYLPYLHTIIERQDVMFIDAWVINRPLEWGISTPNPVSKLNMLVNLHDNTNGGMYTNLGTTEYKDRVNSSEPADLVVFGPCAATVAAQGWLCQDGQLPRVEYQTAPWQYGSIANWHWPDIPVIPAPHLTYHDLDMYKPLTIMSFDHLTQVVLNPVLIADDEFMAWFEGLRRSNVCENPTVGIFKSGCRPIADQVASGSNRLNEYFGASADDGPESAQNPAFDPNQPAGTAPMPGKLSDLFTGRDPVDVSNGILDLGNVTASGNTDIGPRHPPGKSAALAQEKLPPKDRPVDDLVKKLKAPADQAKQIPPAKKRKAAELDDDDEIPPPEQAGVVDEEDDLVGV